MESERDFKAFAT